MIRFCTFMELETRSYCPATMTDAVRKVRSGEVDGMTVDIVNDSGDIEVSYDIQPGRPLVYWYGDDCHE